MKIRTKYEGDWRTAVKGCTAFVGLTLGLCFLTGGRASAEDGSPAADYVGAETCLACHDDKNAFKDNIHAKSWPKAKGIEFSKSCETCHGPGSLHAAAAGDKSNPGYATIKNPKTLRGSEATAACLQCHVKGNQAHWVGGTHESHGLTCMNCHSMHSSGRQEKLMKKADVPETCFQCHKDVKAKVQRNSHHPILEGKIHCADCHNPHGTVGPKMLVANSVSDTCFKCHAEKRGPYLFEHRPVSEDCAICHTPHGSNHNKLLVQKPPFLCQSCHSISRHPGTTYAENPATPGSTTQEKLSNRAYYRGCLNCHQTIHGSNHPSGVYFLR